MDLLEKESLRPAWNVPPAMTPSDYERRDVLTLGETMLRLSPPEPLLLAQCRTFDLWVAGSESNVASGLSVLGKTVTWVSRLPDNALGRKIESHLRGAGIGVSSVVWTAPTDRVGVFYFEPAASPRLAQVVYDRAGSAASTLAPADVPDSLLDRHRHLHVSGITPALSPSCAETVADSVARAKAHGLTVSVDVNYRAKLWTPEQAARALEPLLLQADVLLCSRDDAARLFGMATDAAYGLWERFGSPTVAVTAGADGAVGCSQGQCLTIPAVPVEATVERLGSGDAFAAGFLASFLEGGDLEACLRLGVAAAALKRTVSGDMLVGTRAEVEALLTTEAGAAWR